MIKNRIPLKKLLAFVLFTVVFFLGCFSYALSFDLRGNDEIVGVIFFISIMTTIFLFISAIGFLNSKNWARALLKVVLIILVTMWTIFAGYWFLEGWNRFETIQKLLLGFFSFFVYSLFFGGMFFINNEKFKEEFLEYQVNNDNAIN